MIRIITFAFFISISSLIIMFASNIRALFGDVSVPQMIFALSFPLDSADYAIKLYFYKRIFYAILIFIFIIIAGIIDMKLQKNNQRNSLHFILKHKIKISIIFFIISLVFLNQKLHIIEMINYVINKSYSNFYEKYFVTPNILKAPKHKRNLIYILVESLESTYDNENYPNAIRGGDNSNLIPNLSYLSKIYTNFSDTSSIGGFTQLYFTDWTMAGLLSESCGIPLRLPIGRNSFTFNKNFAKNAICLSDILHNNGYKQVAIMGQDASFAGTRNFFTSHNVEVRDLIYYKEHNLLPKNYWVNWGMEDSKVFKFSKDFLSKIDNKTPFALYISTLNTHTPYGYSDANCKIHNDSYTNAISCSDKEIYDFIEWVKKQSFYKNTTIVVLGDHLSMNLSYFKPHTKRKVFDLFINPAWKNLPNKVIKNRQFSHFDMFPTMLSSLGFEVRKAGLGVNLTTGDKTLLEQIGKDKFNKNLNLDSKLYDSLWY